MDDLNLWLVGGGLFLGLLFGVVVQRTQFCMVTAVSNVVLMRDFRHAHAYFAALLVAIRLVKIDRYERIVGRIYVEDLDVSTEMVRRNALVKSRLPHKFCRLFYFIDSFRDTLKPAF